MTSDLNPAATGTETRPEPARSIGAIVDRAARAFASYGETLDRAADRFRRLAVAVEGERQVRRIVASQRKRRQ